MNVSNQPSDSNPSVKRRRLVAWGVVLGGGFILLLLLLFSPSAEDGKTPASTRTESSAHYQESGPVPSSYSPAAMAITPHPRRIDSVKEIPEEKHEFAESLIVGGDEILARMDENPEEAAEAVHALLEQYQLLLKPEQGLPTGSHVEILDVLLGRNAWELPLFSPSHPALDQQGRLNDPWGSPFFFHVESADSISVRSPGPDRKMWNEDDLVFPPPPASLE